MIDYEPLKQELSTNKVPVPKFVHKTINNGSAGNNGSAAGHSSAKVGIRGKFLYAGEEKFYIKGVTYGAFQPDENGREYTDDRKIEKDFAMMAGHGINTVRIPHTTPPRSLLDIAHRYDLKVMVGLSAEQLVGYLIDKKKSPDIKAIIQEKVRNISGHPALLCIALGNEIPASVVRWVGRKKIENYLRRVYNWVKEIDPVTPVTYVNYPTTEYLQLDFLDMICFNVYLESPEAFSSYLFRLQNIAGDRPLIMGEIGLDCIRNGEEKQAEFLRWQIPATFAGGCAGLFIFSWTDEWFRGGEEVYDWAFGLTDKNREPKPALQLLPSLMSDVPFRKSLDWPFISVVICTYNGSKTIKEALTALQDLSYLNYEVIVVNDGSTDKTLEIISAFDVKIIDSVNMGLSYARNLGLKAVQGEIVAYLDDDAFPDPDWLWYLADMFNTTSYAAIGGPNIEPEGAGFISSCINHTPGTPTHILISDHEAEHIPGCNMAFRKDWLLKIGGFDACFRIAGDDVDICWRIQEAGGKIGFAAGAFVWHHRRNTIKKFWKQQQGYGKAEALLEKKWPEKFNKVGHLSWGGRIYGNGNMDNLIFNNWRIYHGTWGMAPFQSIYSTNSGSLLSVTLMPEWYLVSATLLMLGLLGFFWTPMLFVLFLAGVAILLPLVQITNKVRKIHNKGAGANHFITRMKFKFTIILLHSLQPLARLWGRMRFELTPWRKFGPARYSTPFTRKINIWCENWVSPETRLEFLEKKLKCQNQYIWRGGGFDRWDLKMKGGEFGMATICMAAEDHKEGHQYLRFRLSPIFTNRARFLLSISFIVFILALADKAWIPASFFGLTAILIIYKAIVDCSIATRSFYETILDQKNV
jgi:GT2 family glycosyltransferase